MPIFKATRPLVEYFEQNRDALCSERYGEAKVRKKFLNPFFAAHSRDIFNTTQFGVTIVVQAITTKYCQQPL